MILFKIPVLTSSFFSFLLCSFHLHIKDVLSDIDTSQKSQHSVRCYVVPSATPPPRSIDFNPSVSHSFKDNSLSSYGVPVALMGISGSSIIIGILYLLAKYTLKKRRHRESVLPLTTRASHRNSFVDTFQGIRLVNGAARNRSRWLHIVRPSSETSSDVNNNTIVVSEDPPPSYDQLVFKSSQSVSNN